MSERSYCLPIHSPLAYALCSLSLCSWNMRMLSGDSSRMLCCLVPVMQYWNRHGGAFPMKWTLFHFAPHGLITTTNAMDRLLGCMHLVFDLLLSVTLIPRRGIIGRSVSVPSRELSRERQSRYRCRNKPCARSYLIHSAWNTTRMPQSRISDLTVLTQCQR